MRQALAILLTSFIALPAAASVDSASWNRNLQRLDYYTNPPQGGDEQFFTIQAQTGVIVLIYPTKKSLIDFPLSLYEIRHVLGGSTPTGCTNSFLNGLQYALPYKGTSYSSLAGVYSPTKTYPDPEYAYAKGDSPASDGLVTGTSGFYQFRGWVPESSGTSQTAENACTNAVAATSSLLSSSQQAQVINACQQCLSTNGYWLNPNAADNDFTSDAAVFSTNWLRFYPPKWEIMKLAYKRMVAGPLLGTLREGVMIAGGACGSNSCGGKSSGTDGVGGFVDQKLLPQSCSGQGASNGSGILSQKLGSVEGLTYTSSAYPLAEMLFNDGYYQSGTDPSWCCGPSTPSPYFTNSSVLNSNLGSDNKGGPCPGCNQDFFVIFSDGRGDTANPYCTPDTNGVLPGPCQAAAQCTTPGMGTEADGDNFLSPSIAPIVTGSAVHITAPGTCADDYATDVAQWMANNPMLQSNPSSNVISFVVGLGSNTFGQMNALQAVAKYGKGGYIQASDFSSFEAALEQTLQEIIQRTTSFSVAAITTVQTRGTTSAFIPRFTPEQGNLWNGKLYRLGLFNEFADGCTATDYNVVDPKNPNGNASCNDVYLIDANGKFCGDDSQGNIVLLDTSQPYPWPPMPPLPPIPPGTPDYATPFWEASQVLTNEVDSYLNGSSTNQRTIYTAYDTNADGVPDSLLSFDTVSTDLSTLTPLLELGGYQGTYCTEQAAMSGHTYTSDSQCAADLINYIRGTDVFLQNPYNRTNPPPQYPEARPNILGDIFHSSPILETPPVTTFLCSLGVVTQCSSSLFSSTLTTGGSTAYSTFLTNNQYRQELLIVGANDGMLHAFDAGDDSINSSGVHSYSNGTGTEVWAFIPPDLLPKLRLLAIGTRHELFVDGTPMVKDIWVDGSGSTTADHQKQADEFHTVAIVGERDGGRSYFALDVTTPATPKYLWEWPPVGSTTALFAGRSWDDFAPSPPPVGPIAAYDQNGPLSINGMKASEKYVVAVGGGYDPNYINGAAYYVLDAWTGQQVFRASRMDALGSTDPRSNMFPIAATSAFIDINGDGLYDTIVVGDLAGQLWVSNLSNPGQDTTGDGLYDNWFSARAFVEFAGSPIYDRSPFFDMASAAILPTGDVRVYLGTGNRNAIDDWTGEDCELDDLNGCVRDNCTVDVQQQTFQSGNHYVDAEWKYSAGGTSFAVDNYSQDSSGTGNSASDNLSVNIQTTITCGGTPNSYSNQLSCNWGTPECTGTGKPDSTPLNYSVLNTTGYTPTNTMQNARFYSIHLYDSALRKPFTTSVQAQAYDAAALTDSSLVNADVTTASATGNGYYFQYKNMPERTSSQALVFAGCAVISTLEAAAPPANYCTTSSIPASTSYAYQADAITGAIQCGTGSTAIATTRVTSTSAIVPPPMPTPVVSVNSATSTVSYSGVSVIPGASGPSNLVIGGSDVIGPVEWLEVSKKMHDCRHNGINCK